MDYRKALLGKLEELDGIDSGHCPVVSLDEYFVGNHQEDSIAPNQWGEGRPPIAEIYARLKAIEARPDVQGVFVGLHQEWGEALEDDGLWPAAENIHIYSSAPQDVADGWIAGFLSDGIRPLGGRTESTRPRLIPLLAIRSIRFTGIRGLRFNNSFGPARRPGRPSQVSDGMNDQPTLGVTEEMIASAEAELGLRFPSELREAWRLFNCNEMRNGWRIFPVFDPANPRKSSGSITYENLKGAWGRRAMEQGLVAIADNGTGDQLVLKVVSGQAQDQVFHWHHETHKLSPWKPGIASIRAVAAGSRETVIRLQQQFGKRADKRFKPKPRRGQA